ncbi:MAG TPA: hypothetical protein VGK73_01010 [Polyangiaceae bacterium]
MDLGTRVFWGLIVLLLGASAYFTVNVTADESGVSGAATREKE